MLSIIVKVTYVTKSSGSMSHTLQTPYISKNNSNILQLNIE